MKKYTIKEIRQWLHKQNMNDPYNSIGFLEATLSEASMDEANGITDVPDTHVESENKFMDDANAPWNLHKDSERRKYGEGPITNPIKDVY